MTKKKNKSRAKGQTRPQSPLLKAPAGAPAGFIIKGLGDSQKTASKPSQSPNQPAKQAQRPALASKPVPLVTKPGQQSQKNQQLPQAKSSVQTPRPVSTSANMAANLVSMSSSLLTPPSETKGMTMGKPRSLLNATTKAITARSVLPSISTTTPPPTPPSKDVGTWYPRLLYSEKYSQRSYQSMWTYVSNCERHFEAHPELFPTDADKVDFGSMNLQGTIAVEWHKGHDGLSSDGDMLWETFVQWLHGDLYQLMRPGSRQQTVSETPAPEQQKQKTVELTVVEKPVTKVVTPGLDSAVDLSGDVSTPDTLEIQDDGSVEMEIEVEPSQIQIQQTPTPHVQAQKPVQKPVPKPVQKAVQPTQQPSPQPLVNIKDKRAEEAALRERLLNARRKVLESTVKLQNSLAKTVALPQAPPLALRVVKPAGKTVADKRDGYEPQLTLTRINSISFQKQAPPASTPAKAVVAAPLLSTHTQGFGMNSRTPVPASVPARQQHLPPRPQPLQTPGRPHPAASIQFRPQQQQRQTNAHIHPQRLAQTQYSQPQQQPGPFNSSNRIQNRPQPQPAISQQLPPRSNGFQQRVQQPQTNYQPTDYQPNKRPYQAKRPASPSLFDRAQQQRRISDSHRSPNQSQTQEFDFRSSKFCNSCRRSGHTQYDCRDRDLSAARGYDSFRGPAFRG
jgi:hypothetical protein